MDERNRLIRELENRKNSDTEARNRLLEGLGQGLIQRIGKEEPFMENPPGTPGAVLMEFRELEREIAESEDIIKSLEGDIQRLKELEAAISAKEEDESRIAKELEEIQFQLGKALLEDPEAAAEGGMESSKRQEEILQAKIKEQETRLIELEDREGGLFAWLGKSAQMAVSKGILIKNRHSLQRLYRSVGEQFTNAGRGVALNWEIAKSAMELKGVLSTLVVDLAILKGERRNIGDLFGAEGSPSRRIQGLEKHIAHVKEEFPAVYLRFGSLAAKSSEGDTLSGLLNKEDFLVLERAETLELQIAEKELEIKKIQTSIKIDNEKAEIEKMKRGIQSQMQKIADAEEVITGLEHKISESEKSIRDWETFLRENS